MASWPRGWSTAHLLNLHRSGARGWNWSWLGWEIRSGISVTFSGEAMRTDTASAEDRVRLFRLAWDTCCSRLRLTADPLRALFQGDVYRNVVLLNGLYDKEPATTFVREFLQGE